MRKLIVILTMFSMVLLTCSCGGDGDSNEDSIVKIPYASEEYCQGEWTSDSLVEHFKELGFENVEAEGYGPTESNYLNSILEVTIGSKDEWDAGDEFKKSKKVFIKYNARPALTVDNCSDLVTILTSEDMDYMDFATKYDGRYIVIDGYVDNHISFQGGTSHVIEIKGESEGLPINIDDRSWDIDIDYSVEEGMNVHLEGKVSEEWSKYFKRLTVDTLVLRATEGWHEED